MTFQFPKTSYNSPEKEEVKTIVEQYRKEREQGEDGIAYTTQPYWYGNQLANRVMANYGVTLREEFRLMSKQDKDCIITVGDGSLKRIQYHSPVCRKKLYCRGGEPVLTVREHLQEKYVLADTGYEKEKMRYCEGCGALIDMTKDYAGCPQCAAAVRIHEAHKKIVSIDRELSGSWYQWRFIGGVFLTFMVCVLIANVIGLITEGNLTYESVLGSFFMVLLGGLAFAPVGIVIAAIYGNFLFIPIAISLQQSNVRVNRIGYEMKKRDPQFSHTEFYGLAQSYMKLWFLSADPSDLGCISEVENCQDNSILDVDCLGCKASRVWGDEAFTYVEMKLKVRIVSAQGQKLVKKRTVCTITMKRRKEVKTTLQSEVLKCANCGATIDMLGDGHCTYCGSRFDISAIDWMLCGVRS